MAFLSTKLPWELAQTKWASILNPIIRLPILAGNKISGIDLKATTPKPINHLLQRLPQGWFLVDKDSNANIWRTLPFTDTTITLESSADSNITLYIF
jgi:hypothetical protein